MAEYDWMEAFCKVGGELDAIVKKFETSAINADLTRLSLLGLFQAEKEFDPAATPGDDRCRILSRQRLIPSGNISALGSGYTFAAFGSRQKNEWANLHQLSSRGKSVVSQKPARPPVPEF
jgi:hypothetical protein